MILFKAESVYSDTLQPANRNENINRRIDDCIKGRISVRDASLYVQSPWCRMIRRDLVENNNIQFEEVIACNDTMFTTKVSCLGRDFKVSDRSIYVVTYRSGSLWDSRKTDPKNYLTRLDVYIRRNNYVKEFRRQQFPLLGHLLKAAKVSPVTFIKALFLVISKGALFQGIGLYFRKK